MDIHRAGLCYWYYRAGLNVWSKGEGMIPAWYKQEYGENHEILDDYFYIL